MTSGGRDVVYAGDIELAIEYAVNTEIPAMGGITLEKMPTLYKFLVSSPLIYTRGFMISQRHFRIRLPNILR